MDEQSLVSYVTLHVVLPVNTVIVAAAAAKCRRSVLSVQRPCCRLFMSAIFSSSHLSLCLFASRSVLHIR